MVESAPQSGCPGEGTLLDHARGRLEPARRRVVEAHVARCEECQRLLSHLGAMPSSPPPSGATSHTPPSHAPPSRTPPSHDPMAFGATLPSVSPGPLPPAISAPPPASGPQQVVRVGDVVDGRYEIERILGRGGMGIVAQAHHRGLAQRVALKLMAPALAADRSARARFLREARATAKLEGPHVVRVLDVNDLSHGSAPYMVMELLRGRDLGAVMQERGALPVGEAVECVLQACDALAEAHACGVVHRDLKPANLFLVEQPDGAPFVKVLDFGIAKAAATDGDAGHELTRSGTLLGSPRYMSPEQVQSPRDVDARTDVWSLGVVLWELCAGRPLFDGRTLADVCAQIVGEGAPRLDRVRPEVPEGLALAVAGCLVKDRGHRTPTIGALADALAPFAPARAAPVVARIRGRGRLEDPRRGGGPSRTAVLVVAACLVSSLVGAVIAFAALRDPGPRAAPIPSVAPTAVSAASSTPTPPPAAPPEPSIAPPTPSGPAGAAARPTPTVSAAPSYPAVVPLPHKDDAFRDRK